MSQGSLSRIFLSLTVIGLTGSVAIAGEQCDSDSSNAQAARGQLRQSQLRVGDSHSSSNPSSLSSSVQAQSAQASSSGHQLKSSTSSQEDRPRPCRDEDDTNCYSLVTLECR